MIKNSLAAVGHAARELFRRRGALLVLGALYFAALYCAYLFVSTGVANTWQLLVSAATALAAPLLLLVFLSGVSHFAVGAATAGEVVKRGVRDFWKVLLVALPLVALGLGLCYLLNRLHAYLPAPEVALPPPSGVRAPRPSSVGWQDWTVSTLGLLALGAALPLLAAHLWTGVAGRGLKATIKNVHRVAGRAFAPRSALVYAVGALFFGVLPYFVVFSLPPVLDGWLELTVFGLRLALVFALTLCGWVVTTTALAALSPGAGAASETPPEPATEPRPEPPAALDEAHAPSAR
ncbi:MAG TPA: hypothetical protein VEY09_14230 [Pyrinomonadaceae bacterium]|nr:hypothetical protein [Pyrinomonadaceae bacterium]